eukprot:TRINITY_DN8245_c0_g2_i3.p2 TRINITY_DN8245_c0_g2~~TRINITY_DN8245_c0_g2_i3.p2  ORF type:complete len:109 (+),score=17.61 TRINITY_DN8245_c0_g2_i3:943-1269(+)
MSVTALVCFVLQVTDWNWVGNFERALAIAIVLGISYFFYGTSLSPIGFVYPVLTLTERGFSLVGCQYWLSMIITEAILNFFISFTSVGYRIFTWYLLVSSLLTAFVLF